MNGIFQSNINFVTSVQVFLSKYNGDYASQKEKKMFSEGSNISNTRRRVLSDIQTLRSRLKKRGAAVFFFKRLRGVWISDQTHFRVFDMASQMINNSWRNSRLNWPNFTVIRNTYPNHGHSSDFLCSLLMNY